MFILWSFLCDRPPRREKKGRVFLFLGTGVWEREKSSATADPKPSAPRPIRKREGSRLYARTSRRGGRTMTCGLILMSRNERSFPFSRPGRGESPSPTCGKEGVHSYITRPFQERGNHEREETASFPGQYRKRREGGTSGDSVRYR